MAHLTLPKPQEVKERLNRSKSFRPVAEAIALVLTRKDNPVNKVANATRGNTASEYDADRLRKVQATIVKDSVKRHKEAVKRFVE